MTDDFGGDGGSREYRKLVQGLGLGIPRGQASRRRWLVAPLAVGAKNPIPWVPTISSVDMTRGHP